MSGQKFSLGLHYFVLQDSQNVYHLWLRSIFFFIEYQSTLQCCTSLKKRNTLTAQLREVDCGWILMTSVGLG